MFYLPECDERKPIAENNSETSSGRHEEHSLSEIGRDRSRSGESLSRHSCRDTTVLGETTHYITCFVHRRERHLAVGHMSVDIGQLYVYGNIQVVTYLSLYSCIIAADSFLAYTTSQSSRVLIAIIQLTVQSTIHA